MPAIEPGYVANFAQAPPARQYVYRPVTPDDAPDHLRALIADMDEPPGRPRVTVADYDPPSLERIDQAAALAVTARDIHPVAATRISRLRHRIADTQRIRRDADARAQAQAARMVQDEPQAGPDQDDDAPNPNRSVRRPQPPQTGPHGPHGAGRAVDDAQERQDRARQLAEMF